MITVQKVLNKIVASEEPNGMELPAREGEGPVGKGR